MWCLFCLGFFCPALSKAVKTMKKGEKVLLTVKPQCEFVVIWHELICVHAVEMEMAELIPFLLVNRRLR